MRDTNVKICGITNLADARFCAGAGAHYLGFIQYEGSPRYVEPKLAKGIIEWVYGAQSVGVFVNEDADFVNHRADEVGFAWVQLHGDEPPYVCEGIDPPVIKAIRVEAGQTADELRDLMSTYAPYVEAFLLDTHKAGLYGGTGERFDWRIAADLAQDHKLFLAGGIGPDNVVEAIETVRPFAVDLSSSLEERPGVKDFDKVAAFFEALAQQQD